GVGRSRRHRPIRLEATKMIDAHDVAKREVGAKTGEPPRIALGGMRRPVVERVAPQLAGGREIIRRHARDRDRTKRAAIELKEMRTGPDVRTVECREDRGIANGLHAEAGGARTQLVPLAKEEIL